VSVDPQRYMRVKLVFREALRWAPAERAAVVAALAEDDAAVRDEVLSLLAHHDDAQLLRQPAQDGAGSAAEDGSSDEDGSPAVSDAARSVVLGVSGERTLADVLRIERAEAAERASDTAPGWSLDRVIRVLGPIAHELADAADREAVHGAVHAGNILVDVESEGGSDTAGESAALEHAMTVRLVGWSDGDEDAETLTAAAAAAAAPEQLSPALGPTGPWTDVYALALLCVELLLGRPPTAGSAAAALARACDEAAQPTPRAVGLAVPASVDAVLTRALAMRPMERYQDAGRFWTALRASLPERRPGSPTAAAGPQRSPGSPAPTSPSPSTRPSRTVAISLTVVILLVVVAAAVQRCG